MALSMATRIDAPPVVPARGGLLTAATLHPEWEDHYGFGVSYQSFLCGTGGTRVAPCGATAPGIVFESGDKQTTGSDIADAYPFAVYAAVQCDLIGGPYGDKARAKLAGSEEYLVSKAFYELTVLGDQPIPPVQTSNAPPDSATDLELANYIGELEEYAALVYAGTPVLHMNRRTTARAIAARVVFPDGLSGGLATGQGTPVANAPGYPDDIVFITGQVNLWRGPVATYEVPAQMTNQAIALAERIYLASTECLLAYAGTAAPAPTPDTYVTP